MSDELLPIEPLERALWQELTDQDFTALNDAIVWRLLHATDSQGRPLTTEKRNVLIARHNTLVRKMQEE